MKLIKYDADSPGFIGRERVRLAMNDAGSEWDKEKTLISQVAFFDKMVDFIMVYLDGVEREKVESLSFNELFSLRKKILDTIVGKEAADPKD